MAALTGYNNAAYMAYLANAIYEAIQMPGESERNSILIRALSESDVLKSTER